LTASAYTTPSFDSGRAGIPQKKASTLTRDLGLTNQTVNSSPPTRENQDNRASNQRLVRLLPYNEPSRNRSEPPKQNSEPPAYTSNQNRRTIPNELRQQIITLARQGISRRQIRERLGLRGEKYEIVRQVLDKEGL
jgi:hypothetical protein